MLLSVTSNTETSNITTHIQRATTLSSKINSEWQTIWHKLTRKPEPMLFLTTDMAPTTFRPFGW